MCCACVAQLMGKDEGRRCLSLSQPAERRPFYHIDKVACVLQNLPFRRVFGDSVSLLQEVRTCWLQNLEDKRIQIVSWRPVSVVENRRRRTIAYLHATSNTSRCGVSSVLSGRLMMHTLMNVCHVHVGVPDSSHVFQPCSKTNVKVHVCLLVEHSVHLLFLLCSN
jgi:hypothetical protein